MERRNLMIFENKKLGSGAFGAVYLGKLIGLAKAYKHEQSVLGVNLMRTENCYVAVKMLPGKCFLTHSYFFKNTQMSFQKANFYVKLI